jgi:hypothetical protein
MKRYRFRAPWGFNQIDVFEGESIRRLTIWSMGLDRKESDAIDIPSSFLHNVLGYFGPSSILRIGEMDGTIEQPENPPTNWTYQNGETLEPGWFYEWRLFPSSRLLLSEDMTKINFFENAPSHLKKLAPSQLRYSKHGIGESIPIARIPRLFREKDWIFYVAN